MNRSISTPKARPSVARVDRAARATLFAMLGDVEGGHLTIEDPLGPSTFGGMQPDRHGRLALGAAIRVHDAQLYRRVVVRGSTGLGEGYADGQWDADDLVAALRLLNRQVRRSDRWVQPAARITGPVSDALRKLRPTSTSRDRRNIRAHYDLGNDFFRAMLDKTMAYSCGVFTTPEANLRDASLEKFDRMCRAVDLGPGMHLLEIGTGWGGFAIHAARQYGCRVTTTTISEEQYLLATERVRAEGLEERVTVLRQHYRELASVIADEDRFDAIVAVEMIEAVDWREYDEFFASCRGLLAEHGRMAMQAIVLPHRRFDVGKRKDDFITNVIFPGGCLPSTEALLHAASRSADFRLVHLDDIGVHYAETLRRWRQNLESMPEDIPGIGRDERFRRLWRFYLAYCEAGFDEREISTVQMVLAGPGLGGSLHAIGDDAPVRLPAHDVA